jgi:hypothetical protein
MFVSEDDFRKYKADTFIELAKLLEE